MPSLRGLRILVVDRRESSQRLISGALHEWGAHAVAAGSMEDALKELRATPCNAIVIDGPLEPAAVRALRSAIEARAAKPRVVRLKSFVSLARTDMTEEPWFDAEVTKPLHLAQLYAALTGGVDRFGEDTPSGRARAGTLAPLQGRVLVVEDQALNREVAEGMLGALSLEVDVAENGRQALEKLAADRYDAVLMDCQMPVMDGYSATAELRRREGAGGHTPVIALTADTTNAGRQACIDAGMDDYLGKPFSRATLHAVLARWLAPAEPIRPTETLNRRAAQE
jgi:CheY-like chemotaxis protein